MNPFAGKKAIKKLAADKLRLKRVLKDVLAGLEEANQDVRHIRNLKDEIKSIREVLG